MMAGVRHRLGGALRALDLYAGAGGASRGLQQAGFHVTGVDLAPQPRFCGDRFVRGDAMTSRPIVPNTLMAHAFMLALIRLARRRQSDRPIALPSGAVDPSELARVVIAIMRAHSQSQFQSSTQE